MRQRVGLIYLKYSIHCFFDTVIFLQYQYSSMGNVNCQTCQGEVYIKEMQKLSSLSLTSDNQNLISQFRQNYAPLSNKLPKHSFQDDSVYTGELKDGLKNGYGEFRRGQNMYYGYFKNNIPEGQGLLIQNSKYFLQCKFKNGKPHGTGFQKTTTFDFIGQFQNGKRKNGVLKTSAYTYTGNLKNDLFEGEAVIEYKTGEIYTGGFKHGKFHGIGKYISKNGTFTGMLKNGIYHGLGTYQWSNGAIYDGQYENGVRNGLGRLSKQNWSHEGTWKKGKLVGKEESAKTCPSDQIEQSMVY